MLLVWLPACSGPEHTGTGDHGKTPARSHADGDGDAHEGHGEAHAGMDHGKRTDPAPAGVTQTMCPVMQKNKINPKVFVDHEGRRVYFCCPGCTDAFEQDPQRFLSIIDAQAGS